jgi:O-antigen/teichoic acid export membrane protein
MMVFKKVFNSRFTSDLIFSYGSQGVVILASFLQLYLINLFFGLEIFGQYSIIVATVGIFSSIVTARSSEAVTRFLKREEINANSGNAKLVIFIGIVVDTTTALLLLALSYFSSSWLAGLFLKDSILWFELFLYAFVVLFGFLKGTFIGVLQAKERFKIINILGVLTAILNVFFIYIATISFGNSLKSLIFAFIASSFLSTLFASFAFYYIYRLDYLRVFVNKNMHLIKDYWVFNIKTFMSSSLKAGNQNVENLILGFFVNAEAVGIYQTLKKLLSPVAIAVQPLSMLLYPKMIQLYETKRIDDIQRMVSKVSLCVLAIVALYGVLINISLNYILHLMEIKYQHDYLGYLIIIFFTSAISALLWWCRIFSNTVNPAYSLCMNLLATFYQLIFVSICAYFYGLNGVLFALLLLQVILGICWIYLGKRYVYKNIQSTI